jgi:hypothetical protein
VDYTLGITTSTAVLLAVDYLTKKIANILLVSRVTGTVVYCGIYH